MQLCILNGILMNSVGQAITGYQEDELSEAVRIQSEISKSYAMELL